MIQSYKQQYNVRDNYDTIIIGSGMGGLSSGALLAKEGQKVLILERHYTAGGFTHVFKRKGYEWDVGIHYIGDMQRESPMKKLFNYISNGKLKWADMGDVYDRIIIGNKHYDFVKGVENFKKSIKGHFSEEQEAIDKYVDLVFKSNKAMGRFYMQKALPTFLRKTLGKWLRKGYLNYAGKTTDEVLRSLTKNKKLIKVLTGQYGDYGLPPKQSSFAMHASVVKHYFNGGNFPIGGSSQIVTTIDPVIEKSGGTILINADVNKVIIKNNKAIGVRMQNDTEFYATNIISNTGIFNTYEKLLTPEVREQHGLSLLLQKIKPSVAHACLYIGLKGSPKDLKLPKTNLWIYPEKGDHDSCVDNYLKDINAPFPVVYISFPSAKDPDWTNRYPGHSTIDIITLVPYETFAPWQGSKWMKRGKEYDALKEKISNRLIDHLYEQQPQVKGHIDHYELSTPLTTQHFINYKKGEIYGIEHSPERFTHDFLIPRTPIKNFYLTGQDIVTAGIGGALFAGLLTASVITGKNLMKKVMKS